jgi:hypothetical protein
MAENVICPICKSEAEAINVGLYHFDEVIFETIPTARTECATIIRPILDQMANAGGKATSPIFDDQGRYISLGAGTG